MIQLYELDRPALRAFTEELKAALLDDDREALASLLELQGALEDTLAASPRLIDLFLLPESEPRVVPLWASVRRISRKRAMTKVFTSTHASLEGRLRAYDVLRDDKHLSRRIDRLLNPKRLPWYLRREGASGGWLDGDEREQLVTGMKKLKPSLTPELVELLQGLGEIDGDVIAHDGL